jgi:hypothetical protein
LKINKTICLIDSGGVGFVVPYICSFKRKRWGMAPTCFAIAIKRNSSSWISWSEILLINALFTWMESEKNEIKPEISSGWSFERKEWINRS